MLSALLLARRLQTEIAFWFCVLLLCVIVLKVHLSATAAEDIYPLSGRHTATVRSDYRGERECVYVREGKRERGGSERERARFTVCLRGRQFKAQAKDWSETA